MNDGKAQLLLSNMGCQCCKNGDEENPKLKSSEIVPSEEIAKERIKIQGLEVKNCSLLDIRAEGYALACDTKGNNPEIFKNDALSQIKAKIKQFVREEGGSLSLEQAYTIKLKVKDLESTFFLVPLPLFHNTARNIQALQHTFQSLAKAVRESGIRSMSVDEIGSRYFGFPRNLVAQYLVEAFQVFQDGQSLQQLYYVSPNIGTVHMFEVNLKKLNPELDLARAQSEPKLEGSRVAPPKSELEKPLLA